MFLFMRGLGGEGGEVVGVSAVTRVRREFAVVTQGGRGQKGGFCGHVGAQGGE